MRIILEFGSYLREASRDLSNIFELFKKNFDKAVEKDNKLVRTIFELLPILEEKLVADLEIKKYFDVNNIIVKINISYCLIDFNLKLKKEYEKMYLEDEEEEVDLNELLFLKVREIMKEFEDEEYYYVAVGINI